jgi:UDP-N-acetylmuramate dehydrogenase
MTFAYRKSSLDELALLSAVLEFEKTDREDVTRRMQKQWIMRSASQPTSDRQTACLFVNPQGLTAAELIDQAGQRSARVGGATLFDRDANYVIVNAAAKSEDVIELIEQIQREVAQQVGVDLETALQIW